MRHDTSRMQRALASTKRRVAFSSVSTRELRVKDVRRVPLELRVYLD